MSMSECVYVLHVQYRRLCALAHIRLPYKVNIICTQYAITICFYWLLNAFGEPFVSILQQPVNLKYAMHK